MVAVNVAGREPLLGGGLRLTGVDVGKKGKSVEGVRERCGLICGQKWGVSNKIGMEMIVSELGIRLRWVKNYPCIGVMSWEEIVCEEPGGEGG